MQRLAYLELLRFLLALAVVVYHYFYWGPSAGIVPAVSVAAIVPFFILAVPVFFIVSGFVISFSAENRSNADFAVARFARLGPTLLVCSTITFIVLSIAPLGGMMHTVNVWHWLAGATVAPLAIMGGVDLSLWSLKYEIIFYVLIFGLLSFGMNTRRLKILACVLILSDLIEQLIALRPPLNHDAPFKHYGAYFALGILFYLQKKTETRLLFILIATVAMSLLDTRTELLRVEVGQMHHRDPGVATSVIAGVIAIGIFLLCLGGTGNKPFAKICALVGAASFPLYVIHQFLGYRLISWANQTLPFDGVTARLLTIGVMVFFAVSFSFFVEKQLIDKYKIFATKTGEAATLAAQRLRILATRG